MKRINRSGWGELARAVRWLYGSTSYFRAAFLTFLQVPNKPLISGPLNHLPLPSSRRESGPKNSSRPRWSVVLSGYSERLEEHLSHIPPNNCSVFRAAPTPARALLDRGVIYRSTVPWYIHMLRKSTGVSYSGHADVAFRIYFRHNQLVWTLATRP